MAINGLLEDGYDAAHLVLNHNSIGEMLRSVLRVGKETLIQTSPGDCEREGVPIDLIPRLTAEHFQT